MATALSDADITDKLSDLSGWECDGGSITKTWTVTGFSAALLLANAIGHLANRQNHHPDLKIFGYNNLKVTITTHSEEAITDNDFTLAQAIESL